jgi:uncharacterized protein (TIGR02996 family)
MRSDELLAQVEAHPEDVALYRVWADCLMEEGNPRGEFVTLQLAQEAGQLNPTGVQRLRVLQNAHERSWLGDLGPFARSATFQRGLVAEVALATLNESTVARLAKARIDRVTVPKDARVPAEVFAALLRLELRTLKGVQPALFGELFRAPRSSLIEVGLLGGPITELTLEQMEAALPVLRRLRVNDGSVLLSHLIWSSPLASRLEVLTLERGNFSLTWHGPAVDVEVATEEPPLLRIESELRAGPALVELCVTPAEQRGVFVEVAKRVGARLT